MRDGSATLPYLASVAANSTRARGCPRANLVCENRLNHQIRPMPMVANRLLERSAFDGSYSLGPAEIVDTGGYVHDNRSATSGEPFARVRSYLITRRCSTQPISDRLLLRFHKTAKHAYLVSLSLSCEQA